MKRLLSVIVLTIGLFIAPAFILQTGCSTPGSAAHKTEVITIPTVDAAMTDWAAWVKKGNATQAQLDAVKAQYEKYYAAQTTSKAAMLAYLKDQSEANKSAMTSAVTLAATQGGLVVTLIETYKTLKK